jgi:hypothetical protein
MLYKTFKFIKLLKMSTTEPPVPEFDQIVKGNVSIKKLSKYRYRITFSKIGKFLVYQVWDKDNAMNLNSNRSVFYFSAKEWVKDFNNLKQKKKPLFTPTTIMETECDRNFAFVIDKANVNSSGRVVFTVSTKEISLENNTYKKLTQLPVGKCNNVRFDIDATPLDSIKCASLAFTVGLYSKDKNSNKYIDACKKYNDSIDNGNCILPYRVC